MSVSLGNFLDLKGVGEMLAHASDTEQADFFKGLADHWARYPNMDMQTVYMASKFNHQAEDFIIDLAEYCKLNRENREKNK